MRIPRHIRPGDTIGVTAPSFGATTEPYITRFQEAIRKLTERGYHLKIGETCHKNDGLGISTSPQAAARELTDFYLDDDVDAIISCSGGELMCETMSHVDFARLGGSTPKWFMGYSDNTNFIHPLVTCCNTAAIYGHCIKGFGKPWEQCELDALALLEGTADTVRGYDMFEAPATASESIDNTIEENPLAPYRLTAKKELRSYLPYGTALLPAGNTERIVLNGTLLGGCLDVLSNLAGTRLDKTRDFAERQGAVIWVLEACDYTPLDIRRALWHLAECGWFDTATGFVIGRPLAAWGQELFGVNQYNAATDILARYHVPVIMDADVGHIAPAMPLVMGVRTEVAVRGNGIEITFNRL